MTIRRLLWFAIAACPAIVEANPDFFWKNSETNRITYAGGGTNYLPGVTNDPTVSCFIQLIYAGANNSNDPAVAGGEGTSADDVVVDTAWIGNNGPGTPGWFAQSFFQNDVTGRYFARVWSAPALDYSNRLVPTSPTNLYGDSALFVNPLVEPPGPLYPTFDFGGATGFSTTLSPGEYDTDGDGLPDWWELLHFGNHTSAVSSVDDDGDGVPNLAEFVAGTQPTNEVSVFRLISIQASAVGTSNRESVLWSSRYGKRYDVQRAATPTSDYETISAQRFGWFNATGFTKTSTNGIGFFRVLVR